MVNSPPHLLILEPDPRGHAQEWIEHLLTCALAYSHPPRFSLVVARELATALADMAARSMHDRVQIVTLTAQEQALCTHRWLAVSGFARWWMMRRYLQQTHATHGLFLALDHLSLPLGLGLGTASRPVSGILFRPSVHYAALGAYRPTIKERVRDLRKDLLYDLMLRNTALRVVLSLDPYFPAYAAHRYRHGAKVVELADPAFPAPAPSPADAVLPRRIPEGRITFLLFGELTARKGVLPLLEALTRLPVEIAKEVAIVIAGRLDPPLRVAARQAEARACQDQPTLWLHLEDRRLAAGEIAALVDRSDVILAPYQSFVGSSGILMWAARMQRPVICQEYGLLGQLTRAHALGVTVDTTDPSAIAQAITTCVHCGPKTLGDPGRMAAFAAARQPEHFAATVLNRVLEGRGSSVTEATWAYSGRVVSE
jgi:glycosyltransferase involved in cell wall biosynthesis